MLSLGKCMDVEAYCEARVDQVVAVGGGQNVPAGGRMSHLQRDSALRAR